MVSVDIKQHFNCFSSCLSIYSDSTSNDIISSGAKSLSRRVNKEGLTSQNSSAVSANKDNVTKMDKGKTTAI